MTKNNKIRKVDFSKTINFDQLKKDAQPYLAAICTRLLPDGDIQGDEYLACNPKRSDYNPGSFKINLKSGIWCDFAISGAKGGDVISLVAYLFDLEQHEAAKRIATMVGASND